MNCEICLLKRFWSLYCYSAIPNVIGTRFLPWKYLTINKQNFSPSSSEGQMCFFTTSTAHVLHEWITRWMWTGVFKTHWGFGNGLAGAEHTMYSQQQLDSTGGKKGNNHTHTHAKIISQAPFKWLMQCTEKGFSALKSSHGYINLNSLQLPRPRVCLWALAAALLL